jgi:hypothetical protein
MRESGSMDYIIFSSILSSNIETYIYRETMSDKQ